LYATKIKFDVYSQADSTGSFDDLTGRIYLAL